MSKRLASMKILLVEGNSVDTDWLENVGAICPRS